MFAVAGLERRTFRLSGNHVVVLFDRLTPAEQERLAPLRRDPDFYGVVRTREGVAGSTLLAASREVALLLLTLQQPGPLPSYITNARNPEIDRAIEQLVLDGVLEVECDGAFISGAAVLREFQQGAESHGRISELSRAALVYAAALDTPDVKDLEARLYMYNQAPLTPGWSARIPTPAAVRNFLGLDDGAATRLLNEHWDIVSAGGAGAWIQWIASATGGHAGHQREPTFKLYVSPTLEAFPTLFPVAVRVLAEARVRAFKIGATPRDIARPDKLVAYFRTRDHALECGEMLCAELAGTPVQGVPFSADIGGDGLVSWGVDPPDRRGRAPESSWRRWVCRRLAQYLANAHAGAERDVPAWRFALERLRLEGVDTARWIPDTARMSASEWGAQ